MEQLHPFLSSVNVDPLFDWESFITPPDLEEAFKEAVKEDNTAHRKRKAVYSKENDSNDGNENHHSKKKDKGKLSKRFAPSLSNNEIQQMSIPFVPSNTKMSTQCGPYETFWIGSIAITLQVLISAQRIFLTPVSRKVRSTWMISL